MLSVIYGLISAFGWGAADFTGGIASKKSSPYQVLFLAEIAGLVPIFTLTLIIGEPIPPLSSWLWSAAASALGTFGLLLLYRALAEGQMAVAAPVSALLAAVIPVLVGAITQGLPDIITFMGFGFALTSIWVISQNGEKTNLRFHIQDLRLPLIAGIFFGLYFVLIRQATIEAFFWPMVSARLVGTVIMVIYAATIRGPIMPKREVWPLVMLGGVLDVSGNAFYILAAQSGRFDVAAVLGALYPASTVILARIFLKEKISRLQSFGVLLALGAIALLTI